MTFTWNRKQGAGAVERYAVPSLRPIPSQDQQRRQDDSVLELRLAIAAQETPLRSAPGCGKSAKQGATPLGKYSGQRIAQ